MNDFTFARIQPFLADNSPPEGRGLLSALNLWRLSSYGFGVNS